MKGIKKLLGHVVHGLAKGLSALMDGLIYATETVVLLAKSFLKGCALLLSMGGCLFFLLLIGPLGARLAQNPGLLLLFLVILFIPVAGAVFTAYLKYQKYVITEFLFNLADYWKDMEGTQYRSMRYFKQAFRRAEEERARRERQRRHEEQRHWEERFRQWHQYQGQWHTGGHYAGTGGYTGAGRPGINPFDEFKAKYKKSCEILGVPEDADQYRVKLAYRKKAKAHHPDVNKDPESTKKFQEINDAYAFLNEDNIRRYQQLQ